MVLLDTSFLVALLRRDEVAEKKLIEYTDSNRRLTTTPITACELFKGAYRSSKKQVEVDRVKNLLGFLEILNFSIEAAEIYGRLVNDLSDNMIGDMDAMIASIAIANGESIITSNIKHFERVSGLLVESW